MFPFRRKSGWDRVEFWVAVVSEVWTDIVQTPFSTHLCEGGAALCPVTREKAPRQVWYPGICIWRSLSPLGGDWE